MKKLIKQILREGLISEKLISVDSDVDLLYNKYFKDDIDDIEITGIVKRDMFQRGYYNTTILRDPESVESNKTNACTIKVNYGQNFYNPIEQTIGISINNSALNYVIDEFDGNLANAINDIHTAHGRRSLAKEFTEEKVKGSIHHELAHWVDDSQHNSNIKKRINNAMELNTRDVGGIPVNASKMEINGQIHNIKQLHNKLDYMWDSMTFD